MNTSSHGGMGYTKVVRRTLSMDGVLVPEVTAADAPPVAGPVAAEAGSEGAAAPTPAVPETQASTAAPPPVAVEATRVETPPPAPAAYAGGSSFAAVSAVEAQALPLTPSQRTAIEKLTSGHTLVDSALAAGVNRSTLYRWLKDDLAFAAAFNAWQQDALVTAQGRLLALTDLAVTTMGKAMAAGDGRLAMKLLERMGIAARPQPGSADLEELERGAALKKRWQEVKRRKEEQAVVVEELILPD